MKKKSVILALLMSTVLALCGCSSKGTNEGNASPNVTGSSVDGQSNDVNSNQDKSKAISLRFSWWGNQVRNERTDAVLKMYSEENPGVTFQEEINEFASYWDRLAAQSAGNALPDIIQMDYRYIAQYVDNGLLLDLTPYVESGLLDTSNISESTLGSGMLNEGLYGICNGVNAPALIYNKTITDQAGIELTDNMTMDEFIDAVKVVYEKTGVPANLAYYSGENFLQYYLRDNGQVLFGDGKLGCDESTLVNFFKLYEDGIKEKWHVDPSLYIEVSPTAVEENTIHTGKSWTVFTFSNQYKAYMSSKPDNYEYGMVTWPANNKTQANYIKPSQFFCVTSNSKNPEEAVKVLNYLTNSVESNSVLLGERGVPASNIVAEAISPLLSDDDQVVVSYIQNISEASSTIDPANPVGASEVSSLLNDLVEEICYGQKSAEAQFLEKSNEILGESVK